MTIQEIKKIIKEEGFEHFGLRADNMTYNVGDICENSHQLFQDPEFDEDEELVYPAITDKESPYYGFYDAGELEGTCAIKVTEDSIARSLESVKIYSGNHLYLIAGNDVEYGYDEDEIIIKDAEVLWVIK